MDASLGCPECAAEEAKADADCMLVLGRRMVR
jgi:hypothetical protein